MNQTKIGASQAVILLLLCRVFNILNFIPLFSNKIDMSSELIAIIICTLLNFILVIPAIILLKKYNGQNIIDIAFRKNKVLGYSISFLYGFILLFNLIETVFGFDFFITAVVYPNASSITIILTFCIACFICAQFGLEGIARTATIVFIIFLSGVIFISITSFKNINLLNLSPSLSNTTKQVIEAMMTVTSKNSEIFILLLLAPKIKGNISKCFIWYIILTGIISLLFNFLIITVLGKFAYSQTIPYFTLASICETKILQRLDAVHMVIWVFISFVKVTAYSLLTAECLKKTLPKKAHKYALTAIFAFTILLSISLTYMPEVVQKAKFTTGFMTIFLLTILPLFLIPQYHKKGGKLDENKIDSIVNVTI
ncbi:GerAB/ArcD/ProY family transporter [Paludicola sp. MB14-C6]|uniref:GerAB/ArcD/ProY family transporter n=1 Tax=Paludihabitans sp. MB14-C6 TaxID=3070656 RepID=UPI0027DC8BFE|nr:GerAB/ArcD/ProY family transporter [Paludicola sp. MB14-C6]WMJ23492.1 GerAB/ArcD/ProY family transporter [Paludicola sp. MB14-C6]